MLSRVLVALLLLAPLRMAESRTRVINLPRGPLTRIASPDRKWTLVFECPNDCSERKLWIERERSHSRRRVRDFERSLDISWAPDSRWFFVYDELGSNEGQSYLYDPIELKVIDLADVIVAGDPIARNYLQAGHSYLRAKRWVNSQELLVQLFGHFDGPAPAALKLRHPHSFTLRYQVGVDRTVKKLSESSEEQE
jgi:hypothetical protein